MLYINKKLFYIQLIFLFLVGFKLIRLLPIIGMENIWNLHILVMLMWAGITFIYLGKFFKNSLDHFVFIFVLFLILTWLINKPTENILFIVVYILPIVSYYFFRAFHLKYHEIYKFFDFISISLLIFFLIDFLSNNFLYLRIFDYSFFQSVANDSGRIVSRMIDAKMHPFFKDAVLRVGGVTFGPHSSAVLYAGFFIYHLLKIKSDLKARTDYIFLFLHLIVILLYNVGTAYLVLMALLIFIRRSIQLNFLFVFCSPIAVYLAALIVYGKIEHANLTFNYVINGVYTIYIVPLLGLDKNALWAFFLGQSYSEVINMSFDIDYLTALFRIGIINMGLFILLIIIGSQYTTYLLKKGLNLLPIYYFSLAIILGSVHYESMFRYPGSLLLFGILGIISSQKIQQSHQLILVDKKLANSL